MRSTHRPAALPVLAAVTAFAALWLLAGPLAAYTIYLKDGSTIQAQEKYVIKDGKALIVQINGTRVSYDASAIDVARTERMNQTELGMGVLVEEGTSKPIEKKPPPPQKATLSDLIKQNRAGIRAPKNSTSLPPQGGARGSSTVSRTEAGFPDLLDYQGQPLGDESLAAQLRQGFIAKGLDATVMNGPGGQHPLVRVTTNSEGHVFRALAVAALTLRETRASFPDLENLDLVLVNAAEQRAGQFQLTAAQAEDLLDERVDIQTFYVNHVQF